MGSAGYAAERDRSLIAHANKMSVPTTGGELSEARPTARPTYTAAGRPQRRIRHPRPTVILTALATMLVLLGLATPASADSLRYDNTEPNATGCVNQYTYTVQGAGRILSSTGVQIGIVEMRYSPTCGTKWAQVTSWIGITPLKTWATRQFDGVTTAYGPGGDPGPYYGRTSAYSSQLQGWGYTVCVWGGLPDPNNGIYAYAQHCV